MRVKEGGGGGEGKICLVTAARFSFRMPEFVGNYSSVYVLAHNKVRGESNDGSKMYTGVLRRKFKQL